MVQLRPEEIAELILEAHINDEVSIHAIEGFRLEAQLHYSGLMAKGAYDNWKKKNRAQGRDKVGCFDFKIFRLDGDNEIPMLHPRVIRDVGEYTTLESIKRVISGKDPSSEADEHSEYMILREAQLAMLEQEVNWGDEVFQSWSRFLPSENKRPRDFISAYFRRIFSEPDFIDNINLGRAASGTFGVIKDHTSRFTFHIGPI